MSKRSSTTPVISTPTQNVAMLSLSSPPPPLSLKDSGILGGVGSGQKPSRLTVKVKKYHAISTWRWSDLSPSEVCGICQSSYHALCPGSKFPGDDAPVVWGECGHAFHLMCVSRWLGGKTTCPICRGEWEFRNEEKDDKAGEDDDGN